MLLLACLLACALAACCAAACYLHCTEQPAVAAEHCTASHNPLDTPKRTSSGSVSSPASTIIGAFMLHLVFSDA